MSKTSDDPFDEVSELLGDPVLLKSEELKEYLDLQKKVQMNLKPRNFLDALDARDIVNSIWEGNRYQNNAAELINAELGKAFKKLIDPKAGYVPDTEKSRKAIKDFKETGDRDVAQTILLRKLGIDSSAVEAHAVLLAANEYLIFDKLVANRNAARRAGLKDYERRQRLTLKAERAATKAKRARKAEKKSDWDNDD